MSDLGTLSWPLDRLGDGLLALAQHAGLQPASDATLPVPATVIAQQPGELGRWLAWAGSRLALETEPVSCAVPETGAMLQAAGPAVLTFGHQGQWRVMLLVAPARGRHLRVLAPDGRVHRCEAEPLRAALCAHHEVPLKAEAERLVAQAGLAPSRRPAAVQALLAERLAGETLHRCWLLRASAGAPLRQQLALAGLPRRVAGMLLLVAIGYVMELAGWQIVGQAALDGRLDMGWLLAWALLLVTLVPLRSAAGWLSATFSQGVATLLKKRLLAGALRLDLDLVRSLGAGQWLAQMIESQALEAQGLAAALGLAVSLLELGFAAGVLLLGAAPLAHGLLLAAWLLLLGLLAWRFHGRLLAWSMSRLALTHRLVEDMVGHRTRLAQEQPARRDAEQDRALAGYLRHAKALDDGVLPIAAAAPGLWLLLGLAALAPSLAAATPLALAVSVGGLLLAHRALGGLSGGLISLARARIAWQQVAPLFRAGAGVAETVPFVPAAAPASDAPLLQARGLGFAYRAGDEPVLRGVDLSIGPADRVLLQGASGGGKSTLAALMTGLRQPDAGLLLLRGLDRHTLGAQWHRIATEAPQFHDNHVLGGTLVFNLLLGHEGPIDPAVLAEARRLCEELGLGELLARMPAALQQRVGETGWQLSHGERSRVFLARALLQRAPLTVLDESFAALDPPTLRRCLEVALKRTQALVVVAHP